MCDLRVSFKVAAKTMAMEKTAAVTAKAEMPE
jgi:hypothetical protein